MFSQTFYRGNNPVINKKGGLDFIYSFKVVKFKKVGFLIYYVFDLINSRIGPVLVKNRFVRNSYKGVVPNWNVCKVSWTFVVIYL